MASPIVNISLNDLIYLICILKFPNFSWVGGFIIIFKRIFCFDDKVFNPLENFIVFVTVFQVQFKLVPEGNVC